MNRLNQIFTSIIIPCRNEQKFIDKCLESIIANDYPKDKLEVLLVDGMSDDGTREIVERYAKLYSFIKVFDNQVKITPCALNIGIKYAKGNIIMRMDAHSSYEKNYISTCVKYLNGWNADNVGGIWEIISRRDALIGKAIVFSLSHRFGIGNAYYRLGSEKPRWVDTVPFFCCRKEVFERIGPFNEKLARGQDIEFNLRLKKAGGKTLLVPDIVSYYYARSDLKSFWNHNWTNGVWAIRPFLYSDIMPVSWRHLVPLVFVTSLLGLAILAFMAKPFLWLFLLILSSYGLGSFASSFQIAYQKRDIRYLIAMPFIFGMLHIGYGLGSLWGVFKFLLAPIFWSKLFRLVWWNRKGTR